MSADHTLRCPKCHEGEIKIYLAFKIDLLDRIILTIEPAQCNHCGIFWEVGNGITVKPLELTIKQ